MKYQPVVRFEAFVGPHVLFIVLYSSNLLFTLHFNVSNPSANTDIVHVSVSTLDVWFGFRLLTLMSHVTAQETDESSWWRKTAMEHKHL